jgi:tRNA pseudouridine32 synthase/23S rRNA pseudouridine746 synthase
MAADAVETIVVPGDPDTACAVLAARSGLSKIRVKDAMQKGAAWLTSKRGKRRRIRRATTAVVPGDRLALYYDAAILAAKPPRARMVADRRDYSVWFKPAGLMTQGTDFGDHCCLLRQVDVFFRSRRPVFPVHRLDREAAGILLLAHSKSAAAKLSRLFRNRSIAKHYRAEVLGPIPAGRRQRIEVPLDGKPALTEYALIAFRPETGTSCVDVWITTGRLHQIRRHFDMIGHPVIGDPRYGTGNKNTAGLRLAAVGLAFDCPFSGKTVRFTLPPEAAAF